MPFFAHEKAICESSNIGDGTKVWAFAHILPESRIGSNCNICDGVFIENDVIIGNDCTIKCGVQLWDGVRLENRVFIGPNVSFTNDRFPRSKVWPSEFSKTLVKEGVSIGANATILPGIELGENCMIGAGAVVTCSVPANAVVVGNPARIVKFIDASAIGNSVNMDWKGQDFIKLHARTNCSLYRLPSFADRRGNLTVFDLESFKPFSSKRIFTIQDVPLGTHRGNHAHWRCHQFLICLKGSCQVMLDDGNSRIDVQLDSNTVGIHVPPLVWGVQYKFSEEAVLMVLASDAYDKDDYISDYAAFLRATSNGGD